MKSASKDPKKVLVIDVGGTNVKVLASGKRDSLKIPSGPHMTPAKMVKDIKRLTKDWEYECVSIGFPGPVVHGQPLREPRNLGKGWINFDFTKAFGYPVKLINDAAMQAIGSYRGGRMLFLGLGSGLGSAIVIDGVVGPMELGHLPYKNGKTFEEYVGAAALKRLGRKKWQRHVAEAVTLLRDALEPEYVVLGGGNVGKLKQVPPDIRLGDNRKAFVGGFRLWDGSVKTPTRVSGQEKNHIRSLAA
jgi:polyphosphate glucokinase